MTTTRLSGDLARNWLLGFLGRIEREHEQLTELDRLAGDGDFGWNMAVAAGRAQPLLGAEIAEPPAAFRAMSDAFLAAGGTSGPLFGLWFGRLAAGPTRPWSTADLATAVAQATEAVQRLGGAQPGDRTMVDALVPAGAALDASIDEPWPRALAAAAEAAMSAADATGEMVARRGRATYLGARALGARDPGAVAVAWLFAAGQEAGV